MRKALIAVIVASALFAVGALAAQISVDSDDVASGEAPVGACGEAEVVSYNTSTAAGTSGTDTDWTADGAVVRLVENTTGSCVGADVDIAIGTDGVDADLLADTWVNGSCSPQSAGSLLYNCDFDATAVRPIVEVAVLVNGNSIKAA